MPLSPTMIGGPSETRHHEQRVAAQAQRLKRVRVAMILYRDDLHVGGSLRLVETLAKSLDPSRAEVHLVFAYGGPGPVSTRIAVPCHFLRAEGPLDFRAWVRARRFFAELNPDILHFHNPAYWLHAALAGSRCRKIFHVHGPYFLADMGWWQRLLAAQMQKLVDAEVCITRGTRKLVVESGWGHPTKTWTAYNAIDCNWYASTPSKEEARDILGLPRQSLILGVVCRLAWYKGCQDALRILSRLDARWHLVFCGDGPMRQYLVDIARQEEISERIHFAGMLDDMRPAYAAMDALLFLSRLEPFGLVMAEAMACRVPVFGLSGEGDYRDPLYPLVTPENSIFVNRTAPEDYSSPEPGPVLDALVREIKRYGEDPDPFQPMVEQAYRWVLERFDSRVQSESMLKIYDLVLGRPTDSPK